ncbi:MAG TPA: hypothetical protein VKA59_26705 [Vicinamibacterales bacterium]|nr:hypothetical protein [Vicinamibacterales bacterium]
MRAMVYRGPGRIRVGEKDIPAIEHPNDAIVQVTCAAICGSDLHLYSNCHNVNPNASANGGIYGYSHTCTQPTTLLASTPCPSQ